MNPEASIPEEIDLALLGSPIESLGQDPEYIDLDAIKLEAICHSIRLSNGEVENGLKVAVSKEVAVIREVIGRGLIGVLLRYKDRLLAKERSLVDTSWWKRVLVANGTYPSLCGQEAHSLRSDISRIDEIVETILEEMEDLMNAIKQSLELDEFPEEIRKIKLLSDLLSEIKRLRIIASSAFEYASLFRRLYSLGLRMKEIGDIHPNIGNFCLVLDRHRSDSNFYQALEDTENLRFGLEEFSDRAMQRYRNQQLADYLGSDNE